MSRFRKGTNDHDGDGKKGGSLKAGSRFVRGTNDPDNDGHRGGSLPKGDKAMAKAARKSRAKAPDKAAGVSDQQSGGAQASGDDVGARKRAAAERFSEADQKADPAVEEARLSREIRGW